MAKSHHHQELKYLYKMQFNLKTESHSTVSWAEELEETVKRDGPEGENALLLTPASDR